VWERDVAVLFETTNPQLLRTHVFAQQTAARAANSEIKPVSGDIEGVGWSGVVSPDRSVSSYVASVTNVVFISNSLKQLENLVRAAQGKVTALGSQMNTFSSVQRYPRNDRPKPRFWSWAMRDSTLVAARNGALPIRGGRAWLLPCPNCRPPTLMSWLRAS